jgi:hypothetical protein
MVFVRGSILDCPAFRDWIFLGGSNSLISGRKCCRGAVKGAVKSIKGNIFEGDCRGWRNTKKKLLSTNPRRSDSGAEERIGEATFFECPTSDRSCLRRVLKLVLKN